MPSEHSSRQYELDLEAIRSKVLLMGGVVEKQFQDAMICFRNLNEHEADRIIAADFGVADQFGQIARRGEGCTERFKIGFDRGDGIMIAGQIEERGRITPLQARRDAAGILHARRVLPNRVATGWKWARTMPAPCRRGRA